MPEKIKDNWGHLLSALAALVVVGTVLFNAGSDHRTVTTTAETVKEHDTALKELRQEDGRMGNRLTKIETKVGLPTP